MKFQKFNPKLYTSKAANSLSTGITRRLTPDDQFNSFVATITLNAGEERFLANTLRDMGGNRIVPGEWQVIDSAGAPAGAVARGNTAWTQDRLYLRNTSEINGQFRIRFMARARNNPQDLATTAPLKDPGTAAVPTSGATYLRTFLLMGA
jgi:hypothetical protein